MYANIGFMKTDVKLWPVNISFLEKTDVNVNIILLTSVLYWKPMLDLYFKLCHTRPSLLVLSSSLCNLACDIPFFYSRCLPLRVTSDDTFRLSFIYSTSYLHCNLAVSFRLTLGTFRGDLRYDKSFKSARHCDWSHFQSRCHCHCWVRGKLRLFFISSLVSKHLQVCFC